MKKINSKNFDEKIINYLIGKNLLQLFLEGGGHIFLCLLPFREGTKLLFI